MWNYAETIKFLKNHPTKIVDYLNSNYSIGPAFRFSLETDSNLALKILYSDDYGQELRIYKQLPLQNVINKLLFNAVRKEINDRTSQLFGQGDSGHKIPQVEDLDFILETLITDSNLKRSFTGVALMMKEDKYKAARVRSYNKRMLIQMIKDQ